MSTVVSVVNVARQMSQNINCERAQSERKLPIPKCNITRVGISKDMYLSCECDILTENR